MLTTCNGTGYSLAFQKGGRSRMRKYWSKARFYVWFQNPFQISNNFQLCNCIILLRGEGSYFHFLLSALLSRYPMTLLFPTSWRLQCKPHFNFTASSNVLSRPPCRDTPTHTWPQELCKVIIHNPFLVFLTLNPGPNRQTCQILLFAENETRPLHSNIFSLALFF